MVIRCVLYDILQQKCTAKLRGDDTQRRHLQARFKRMARHDKDVFLNEVASEAEMDVCRGKIGSVFRAVRLITGNDLSSLQKALSALELKKFSSNGVSTMNTQPSIWYCMS